VKRAPRKARRWVACAGALSAACLLTACVASLDFDRARHLLDRPPAQAVPVLQSGPATAALPAPEGLRATSGELRMVPLKWDPVLTGAVGGYVIERSQRREGPFERLAVVPGALTTTYVDAIASVPASPPAPVPIASSDSVESRQAPAPAAAPDTADVAAAPAEPPAPAETSEVEAFEDGFVRLDLDAEELATSTLDGVTFFYRVRAFGPAGEVATSASRIVTATTAPPPEPPEDLRAYSHQPRNVPLSWRTTPDPTVAGYRVDRSPTSLGPFEVVAQLDGRHTTTYVDQGLGDLRVFYYRVAALNAAGGNGAPTAPVRAVTKPEPLPPVGLRVVDLRLGENHLAWEPNVEPDIAEYRLFRQRDGASTEELVRVVPRGTFEARDAAVGADEHVVYSVVALDEDGLESSASDPIEVESEGYDLRGSAGPDGVRLQWNPRTQEGFRGARVFRGGVIGQREFPPVAGSSFVDTDVKPGHSYRYTVALIDAAGATAPRSATVEVRVPPK